MRCNRCVYFCRKPFEHTGGMSTLIALLTCCALTVVLSVFAATQEPKVDKGNNERKLMTKFYPVFHVFFPYLNKVLLAALYFTKGLLHVINSKSS